MHPLLALLIVHGSCYRIPAYRPEIRKSSTTEESPVARSIATVGALSLMNATLETTSVGTVTDEPTTELPFTRTTNDTVNDDEITDGWRLFTNYLSDAWENLETLQFAVIGLVSALAVLALCWSYTILKFKVKLILLSG